MRFLCLLLVSGCIALREAWHPVDEGAENGKLLQAHILFRHGHRVPMKSYPRDPNANATLWDDGYGQLTNIGRRQAFQLGRDIRARYGILVAKKRAWRSVRTVSSDYSRTLMSAQAVLAGLLPPEGSDRWSDLDWQPAPVRTKPQYMDDTLSAIPFCPRYLALLKNQSNVVPQEARTMYDYVQKHSGKTITSPTSLANLYICLDIERQAGLRLPEWTRTVYPEPMKSEAARSFLRSVATREMARLRVGPLLKDILRFNKNSTGEPLRLYSTHDTVLAAFLGALGISSNAPPNFASVISVEHWRTSDGETHVQLWWREGPSGELTQLEWPECGKNCPLHRLKRILGPLIPEDWQTECEIGDETSTSLNERRETIHFTTIVFVMSFIMLVVVIPIYVLMKYRSRSRGSAYEYVR
ncbi:Testicular acid phosphatase homolog [Eumeta japonica]|uniref:Testicular acid phosphatase homolog n=1 Tax=Eumeta variegata TaxID=151549 RepID=A0A4C1TUM0_EUMVA|nr:Testicular acid phosphatase homolog [Eumeta japonica]